MKKSPAKKAVPKARKPRLKIKAAQESTPFSFHEPIARDPETQRMIDAMIAQSNRDTEAQRAHVESLKGPRSGVNEAAEVYSYTTFPAPIHDYLDYIKSTKNNLSSWSDLKDFIKTTEGFWKTMRDQSCKIALGFAKKEYESSFYIARGGEDVSSNKYYDKGYYRKILGLYMEELKREMECAGSKSLGDMVRLISDYDEHEREVALSATAGMRVELCANEELIKNLISGESSDDR